MVVGYPFGVLQVPNAINVDGILITFVREP